MRSAATARCVFPVPGSPIRSRPGFFSVGKSRANAFTVSSTLASPRFAVGLSAGSLKLSSDALR